MITRGHLIGQIVDDLANIASQAKQRARLGFTDLHVHVENFARELLNRTLGLSLRNLNEERSNAPGLDLGDEAMGWAFQVTGDKSLAKAKATLEKITAKDRAKYTEVRILVIGEKQGSYSMTGEPFASAGFTEEMIWDFDDMCRRVVGLQIEDLHSLQQYVARETQRVRIELEVPDRDGRYETSIERLVEALPKPTLSDASAMDAYFSGTDWEIDRADAEKNLAELSEKLSQLPRLTREVFKMMVERRDQRRAGFHDKFRISVPMLERIYRSDDLDGDLALLKEVGLAEPHAGDEHFDADYWSIEFPGYDYRFHDAFIKYVGDKRIGLQKPLVTLDFSDF